MTSIGEGFRNYGEKFSGTRDPEILASWCALVPWKAEVPPPVDFTQDLKAFDATASRLRALPASRIRELCHPEIHYDLGVIHETDILRWRGIVVSAYRQAADVVTSQVRAQNELKRLSELRDFLNTQLYPLLGRGGENMSGTCEEPRLIAGPLAEANELLSRNSCEEEQAAMRRAQQIGSAAKAFLDLLERLDGAAARVVERGSSAERGRVFFAAGLASASR